MSTRFNNIDELLKKSLTDYDKKPSAKTWQKISMRLWLMDKGMYFLVPVILLTIIAAYFLFIDVDKNIVSNNTEISRNIIEPEILRDSTNPVLTDKNEPNPLKNKTSIVSNKHTDKLEIPEKETGIVENNSEVDAAYTKPDEIDNFVTDSYKDHFNQANAYPGLASLSKTNILMPTRINSISGGYSYNNYLNSVNLRSTDYIMSPDAKPDKTSKDAWSYGIHITPELIFTNDNENSKKKALNFDLTGIYTIHDFYLQFGAGIGLSNDKGKFNINYAQFDSIGYYYEVTGFTINPQTGAPVFKTELENVYDTVLYNDTKTTDNLYTYFRIPVFAGLRVHENKGFSISLKAGGTYSLLIDKKEPGTSYSNDNATWIIISDETQSRIQSNVQLSVGIGMAYQIKNKLSISAEPMYNYYINPVYVNNLSSKAPWSIGLRTGILFKF